VAQAAWRGVAVAERTLLLDRWAAGLVARHDELVTLIIAEVGKPRRAADDEVRRAVAHVHAAADLARQGAAADRVIADGVLVRHAPVGVIGILMPWNNPLALPCGKIAPALALGNAVVFKPAPEGARTAALLMRTLADAGLPADLVTLVNGDAAVGAALVREPLIDAVAVTGSIATGRAIAAACAARGIPLQAELGGNNAAIVLADADLDAVVPALVRNAFAFAGQRCTAIRRFVVEVAILDEFTRRAVEAIADLRVGEADDAATDVGPLITTAARDRVAAAVAEALDEGAQLLAGGRIPEPVDAIPGDTIPSGSTPGDTTAGVDDATATKHAASGAREPAWFAPTLLLTRDRGSAIVQVETFGPVAVIQPAADLDEAIAIANDVEQGLLMAILTSDPAARDRALALARVGIVQFGPGMVPVHPDAPFGGWKASGLGPPEHGEWDAQFLTRPQAIYQQ
jgi:aldehyde dehydrogenase (NAD+)